MVKQPDLFSPKFGATSSHVFTQSPQKPRSITRNSQFGLLGPVLRATTVRNILDGTSSTEQCVEEGLPVTIKLRTHCVRGFDHNFNFLPEGL
jgi:hypothetical protein